MRARACRWWVGIGLSGLFGMAAVLMPGSPARGQKTTPDEGKPAPVVKPMTAPEEGESAPVAKPPRVTTGDRDLDERINQAKEELELLQVQLEAKKAILRISEARLQEARRRTARYEELIQAGRMPEERFLSAKDDMLMMEADVAGERAEIKVAEMRVNQAKRRIAYGEFPTNPLQRQLSDIEHRMAVTESKLDMIQQEVGRLRRETPTMKESARPALER